jgi:hypothetical protein
MIARGHNAGFCMRGRRIGNEYPKSNNQQCPGFHGHSLDLRCSAHHRHTNSEVSNWAAFAPHYFIPSRNRSIDLDQRERVMGGASGSANRFNLKRSCSIGRAGFCKVLYDCIVQPASICAEADRAPVELIRSERKIGFLSAAARKTLCAPDCGRYSPVQARHRSRRL